MNVNDFEKPDKLPSDFIKDIFARQHKLAKQYLPIEEANGLLITSDIPVNIHDNKGQARLKDMAWRCTEELTEAMEALDKKEYTHFYEELADAMHFLVEFCILADFEAGYGASLKYRFYIAHGTMPPNTDCVSSDLIYLQSMTFLKHLGLSCNCLKNKPWKQSQHLTDRNKFHKNMSHAFQEFIHLCKVAGFDETSLYCMYVRKYQVNEFRQESDY